jgi:hypothetical protein
MTTTKPGESRAVAGRTKPAGADDKAAVTQSTTDSPQTTYNDQNPVLDQLVSLTRSISTLVQQNAGTTTGEPATTDNAQQTRVVFAYDFLGAVLGRRAPSVFQLKIVTVTRDFGSLTFTGLAGATVAKIRAANNTVQVLQGLREGEAVVIDQGVNAIPDEQRIDSIVTFTALGGVPVAIGPCLGPVSGGIIV